ncbi:MAG: SpoIIE family protein phosphatase [Candidatus Marinimicrobia bacterium]|nr:SpoIIE family protein phosphatase [Candidatus Neomarinimicrobiota bacterium]
MQPSIESLQNDFGNIAISMFVIAIGLIALVVFLFRLNRKNFTLLNFGLFSALYGLRWLVEIPAMQALMGFPFTLPYFHGVLTYLFVIPFCALLVNIFGKGLYNSMLLVLYSAIAYAVIAIIFHVLGPGTSSDVAINRVVVIIWGFIGIVNVIFIRRKGDIELVILRIVFFLILLSFTINNIPAFNHYFASVSLEHVSFVLLILGLGYVAMHHTAANERKLESIEQEIEIARRIQQFNLPSNVNSLKSINIAARYIPASTVAGDFYDIQRIDEAKAGILIADVSGHGVGAALIGSMLKIAFSSQAQNVSDPAKVLSEINRILQGKLESSFVTACAVFIDMQATNWFTHGLDIHRQFSGRVLHKN